ncbi:terminus macrodomain insulation protein YfbV [Alteromonas lipotrueiana]|uniref:terminus macrodomain insulation protein YfbV n=1 Tax=Alteromonas lipotrueiana TaxID=2803815 RepID=UPI001C46BE1D|nr:terminus macrodomain insulation protein YfbV [Alteromonas lipotrueiana]
MAQSMVTMFRQGHKYLNTWPNKKQLYAYFPECKVIAATRLAIRSMPPLAVVSCALLLDTFGTSYLPQAIAIGAFFLSLPLQGLLWLGQRADQPLPASLKNWYFEIYSKLQEEGCEVQVRKSEPKYQELAMILKAAFEQLDQGLTRSFFN